MALGTLYISAVFSLVSCGVYAFVGRALSQRKVSEEAQLASTMFSVWWYALAGVTLEGGLLSVAGAAGYDNVQIVLTLTYVGLFALCAALWGLVYYLVYLFTGSRRAFAPITIFYVLYFFALVYFVSVSNADAVLVNRWNVSLHYTSQPTGPLVTALGLLIIVPEFLGALAYGTYYFRVEEKSQKFRVAVVSVSLLIWFGSPLVAQAAGVSTSDAWQIASRFIGLAASLAILVAYIPPRWMRERFGVKPVERRGAPDDPPRSPRAAPVVGVISA